MAQQLINVGGTINDGTGEVGPRGWLQKIAANTAELYLNAHVWDSTVIASQYAGATNELKLTAAIADAAVKGKKYCWVSQSMLPYSASLVTFNNAVRMTGEGMNPGEFNVRAYGAAAAAGADDKTAIQAAINAAVALTQVSGAIGAVVRFPSGSYAYNSTLQVPVMTNGSIVLRGDGMRQTYLYPTGPSTNFSLNSDGDRVCLVFGTLTPDPSGTSTNQTAYCGMEDMSQNGGQVSSGSVVAHQITEMQYGWMQNSLCENFPNASIGLYLRGSTITSGLGQTAGPHVRLCTFYNVIIATIGSNNLGGTPLLIQNGDENSFFNCTAAITPSQTISADSAFCIWIQNGRNNGFYRCLEQGNTASANTGYVGFSFGPPQDRSGAPPGTVTGNQVYGDVIEGVDRAVWFRSSPNVIGNMAIGINPSIVTTNFQDDNPIGGNRGNTVFAPMMTPPINYFDGPPQTPSGASQFTLNSTTPSVAGNNVWVSVNNAGTIITSFTNTTPNQVFWVRLTTNDTIRDVNNGGGGDIQCWGRQDIAGQTGMWVGFLRVASVPATYQITHPLVMGNSGLANFQFPVVWASKFVALSEAVLVSGLGAAGSLGNYFKTTLTAARVVGAPLNPIAGQRITNTLLQDGTGGWAVTWNAVFKNSWVDTGNTLNKRSTISHIYDGTNWNQDGAQTPYIT